MMTRDQTQTVLDALKYMTVTAEHKVNDAIPNAAIAILQAALAEPSEPIEPNNDEVICPKCAHQFRAIPVNVQKLLMDKGIEPPFTHPASKPAPLTFEQVEDCFPEDTIVNTSGSVLASAQWLHDFARAIEAAVWEKAK